MNGLMPMVTLTDAAVAKVKDMIAEDGTPNLKLRIYVSGGGCSGFQYGFAFDDFANDDDVLVEKDGITLLIDVMSAQYLDGAIVDYRDEFLDARFIFTNPNASSTCGCGSSFSV